MSTNKHITNAAESILKAAETAVADDKKDEALKCIALARDTIRTMGLLDHDSVGGAGKGKTKPTGTKAGSAFSRGLEPGQGNI